MLLKTKQKIKDFIKSYPKFHIVVYPENFVLHSIKPPDWANTTEKEYAYYEKHNVSLMFDENPSELLKFFIEEFNGSVTLSIY